MPQVKCNYEGNFPVLSLLSILEIKYCPFEALPALLSPLACVLGTGS